MIIIAVVFQDKRLTPQGQIDYKMDTMPTSHMMMSLPPVGQSISILRLQPTDEVGRKILPDSLAQLPTLPKIDHLTQRYLHLLEHKDTVMMLSFLWKKI